MGSKITNKKYRERNPERVRLFKRISEAAARGQSGLVKKLRKELAKHPLKICSKCQDSFRSCQCK
jgi:hypothetical protein